MEEQKAKRQNTKLESEGAEFLVLGLLLIEGISAYKAYINFPGYDITTNADNNTSARIQVKSRWATDYDNTFPLKSLDCDFIVHVALNRGYRFNKSKSQLDNGIQSPIFYVFPVEVIKNLRSDKGWNKVNFRKLEDYKRYIDRWDLIKEFLERDNN